MHGHLACPYALARACIMLDDSGMLVHGRIGGVCVASMLGGKASCPCYVGCGMWGTRMGTPGCSCVAIKPY